VELTDESAVSHHLDHSAAGLINFPKGPEVTVTFPMEILYLASNGNQGASEAPLWATALIALAAAFIGAIAGGYASYRASVASDKRVREARAAIRKKAKLYTPLRSEIISLQEDIEEQPARSILTPATDSYYHFRYTDRPGFYLWDEMTEDGRALSASPLVQSVMAELHKAIDRYNGGLKEVERILNPVFHAAAKEAGLKLYGGASVDSYLNDVLNRSEGNWMHLGGYDMAAADASQREEKLARQRRRMQEILVESEEAKQGRMLIAQRKAELSSALGKARLQLESTMRSIATKYEMETTED
jgi:hypothetical protein